MTDIPVELKITGDPAQGRKALADVRAELDALGYKQTEVGRAAQQAAGVTTQAYDGARISTVAFGQASQQSAGLVNNTSRSIKQGIDSISTQLDAARGHLLAFLGVQGGVAGAKEVARLADEYRDLQSRIGLVVGHGKDLATTMDQVRATALRTNTSLDTTGNLLFRLSKVAQEAGRDTVSAVAEAQQLTETINQAVQVSGGASAASEAAIRQLIQGLQSGVLRGDEFNSVMEQAPRLAEALAKGLNTTTGELRTMAEAGQLTATTVVNALHSQGDAVKAEFSQLPMTVGRAMQNLRTQFQLYVADTDAATGASATTAKAIGALADNIGAVSNALLHAGMTFGAWKALNMAKDWIAVKLAIEQETIATAANTKAKASQTAAAVSGAAASRQAAVATRESAAALTAHATASAAATASMRAHRLALEAERAAVPPNAKAWGELGAALGGATAKKEAAGAAAVATTGKLGGLLGAVGGLVRGFGPLLALDIALNFKQYGTWIGEATAKLMGHKDRTAELAAEEKRLAKAQQEAALARAEMARKTQAAIEQQYGLSKAAGAAVANFDKLTKEGKTAADAVGEITKNFDLTKAQGIRDFAGVLQKLTADGKVNAEEFRAAWAKALEGKDLRQFEGTARNAFLAATAAADQAAEELRDAIARGVEGKELEGFREKARVAFAAASKESESWAQLQGEVLRSAVQRSGLEFDVLQNKVTAAARSAINDVDVIVDGLVQLKAEGVDTGRLLNTSISQAINAADTEAALDLVRGQIEQLREQLGTKVADGLLERASERAKELRDAVDKATPGINSVREAFAKLGVTSDEVLKKTAKEGKEAYDQLVNSGKASSQELRESFKVAAEAAIKAADGVAPEWVKLEAKARGYKLEVDKAGDAHLTLADKAKNAAGEVAGAFERMGLKTNQQLKDAAAQARTDFNTIENSGQASAEAIEQAFVKYANAAIAANGGVADDLIHQQAAARGLAITYDDAGKAVVKTFEEMGRAAERAGARSGKAAAQAARDWKDAAKEVDGFAKGAYGDRQRSREDARWDDGRKSSNGQDLAKGTVEIGSGGDQYQNKEGWASDASGKAVVGGESMDQLNQRVAKLFGEAAIGNADAIAAANLKIKLDEAAKYGVANVPGNNEYMTNLRAEFERLSAAVLATSAAVPGAKVKQKSKAREHDEGEEDDKPRRRSGGNSGMSTSSTADRQPIVFQLPGEQPRTLFAHDDESRDTARWVAEQLAKAKKRAR